MSAAAAAQAARRFAFKPLPVVKQLKRATSGGMLAMPGRRSFRTRIEYLINTDVANDIVSHLGPLDGKVVLELSPGPGYLTQMLLNTNLDRLIAIEDNDFFEPQLKEYREITGDHLMDIAIGDMKSFALYEKLDHQIWSKLDATVKPVPWGDALNEQLVTVGPLPVGYADTVLHRLMRQMAHRAGYYGFGRVPMMLLIPENAYKKATAEVGTLAYNKLALMASALCTLTPVTSYPVSNFSPVPKTTSMILTRLEPRVTPLIATDLLDSFEFIARQLFARRTVPLSDTIHTLGPGAACLMAEAKLDPSRKVNRLSVEEINRLAEAFSKWPDKPVVFDAGELGELVKESINRSDFV